jgi:hypothetical protein
VKRLVGGAAALVAVLALASSASAAGWQQFRNDPAGDGQSTELGAQSAAVAPGFPVNLPPRNNGLSYLNPGNVVVTPSGIVVVADGFQVSAYNPNGQRLWVQNVAPGSTTQGLGFVTSVATSASGATTFVLFSQQDPGGNADPSTVIGMSTSSGTVRWTATAGTTEEGAYLAVDASNNVYVASAIRDANGGGVSGTQVQAFDAFGDTLWTTNLTGFNVGGGVVLDGAGNAYAVTSQMQNAQIVSLATSTGAVNWTTTPPAGSGVAFGAPVVSPQFGLLYVSGGQNGPGVYAYGTAAGANAGLVGTTPLTGPTTLSAGGFLLGSSSANTAVAQSTNGSQSPAWVRGGPPNVFGSTEALPAEAIGSDGTSYIPSNGYLLAANGATGATEWIFRAANFTFGSPAIGPTGTVYAVIKNPQGVTQLEAFQLLPQR